MLREQIIDYILYIITYLSEYSEYLGLTILKAQHMGYSHMTVPYPVLGSYYFVGSLGRSSFINFF